MGPAWDGVARGWFLNTRRCNGTVGRPGEGQFWTSFLLFFIFLGDLCAQVLHGSCVYIISNIIIYFI